MRVVQNRQTILRRALKGALLLTAFSGVSACGVQEEVKDCAVYFVDKPANSAFDVDTQGLATHINSGTTYYRCAAGQAFRSGRCLGEPLILNKVDTELFVEEFSTKSKQAWRLPTSQELKQLVVSECLNPAVDTRLFPDLPIENLWTSSDGRMQPESFQCVMYTYNGSISCKHADSEPLPFLMVRADSE